MRVRASLTRLLAGADLRPLERSGLARCPTTSRTLIRGDPPIGIPRVPADGPRRPARRRRAGADLLPRADRARTRSSRANQATKVYFPDRTLFQNPDGSLRAGVRLDPGTVYTVVSQRPLATPEALRRPPRDPVPEDIRTQYAASPVTTDRVARRSRTRSPPVRRRPTTRCWRSSTGWARTRSTRSTSRACRRAGTRWTSTCSWTARDSASRSAPRLVVMLRELGIPARLAVGYTPGERNPFTGLYEVQGERRPRLGRGLLPRRRLAGLRPDGPRARSPATRRSTPPAPARSATSARGSHVPGELLAGVSIVAGARRPGVRAPFGPAAPAAAIAISRSWASRPASPGSKRSAPRRGRPRAPSETTPTYVRALGALAPERRTDARTGRRDDRRGDVRGRVPGRRRARRGRRAARNPSRPAGAGRQRTRATSSPTR